VPPVQVAPPQAAHTVVTASAARVQPGDCADAPDANFYATIAARIGQRPGAGGTRLAAMLPSAADAADAAPLTMLLQLRGGASD